MSYFVLHMLLSCSILIASVGEERADYFAIDYS